MPCNSERLLYRSHAASIATLIGFVCGLSAAAAAAQQAPPNKKTVFDGQWSLTYRKATKPGGETRQGPTWTEHPINIRFQAAKRSFRFKEDGTFAWEEREEATSHDDSYTDGWGAVPRPVWSRHAGDHQGLMRASGSGEETSRTLKLKLQWTIGSGRSRATYSEGTPGWSMVTSVMSADATTVTITSTGSVSSVRTVPQSFVDSSWTLTPESIEREDAGTDIEKERVLYRQSRRTTWSSHYAVPVTEEIEIIQERYVKLVPRG